MRGAVPRAGDPAPAGLGPGLRLVCLVSVGGDRPFLVAWRLLEGDASEKGKEAAVTKELIEQVLAAGGTVELLLADALYADGPLLATSTTRRCLCPATVRT